jgi:hypothetical protein
MRKFSKFKKISAALMPLVFSGSLAFAQVPSLPTPPYNVDLGASAPVATGTRAFNASASNYTTQTNLAWTGALCTFNMSAASGSASTTFGIQFLDSASATWQTLVTSGAITATATPTSIVVAPAIQTSSLPSGMVAIQMRLPRFWRVTETNTVSNTTATRTIGCNVFR